MQKCKTFSQTKIHSILLLRRRRRCCRCGDIFTRIVVTQTVSEYERIVATKVNTLGPLLQNK